jgi:hypothetical protein
VRPALAPERRIVTHRRSIPTGDVMTLSSSSRRPGRFILGPRALLARTIAIAVLAAWGVSVATSEASAPTFGRISADTISVQAGRTPDFWFVGTVPGESPTSTGLRLWLDLRPFGGPARARFVDAHLVCDDDTTDGTFFACFIVPINAQPGTRDLTLTVADAEGRSSTRTIHFTVTAPPDGDGDGLPDAWETLFGLDPASAGGEQGATGDPDGDGATNLQEFQAGSHPRGTVTRYFAEGASNDFFSTRIGLLNPSATERATVVLRFLGSSGATTWTTRVLDRTTHSQSVPFVVEDTIPPDNDFSVVIESDRPIVCDRTMTWDRRGFGSHAESAIVAPATTWYLAEGATHGAFDLFYLFANPADDAVNVSVEYLRPAPLTPILKTYALAPHERRTIWVDQEGPELAAADVSARITADRPILVERSMYASTATQPFAAGHNGAGVPAAVTRWFLAEGATGFFDLYVLIANAADSDAQITMTYLLPSGETIERTRVVARHSRLTIDVASEDARLANTPVSTIIESTNAVPVVVERAMWWPHGQWYEAHLAAGATVTGTRWAFADGEVRAPVPGVYEEQQTYILIANTSATDGTATISLIDNVTNPTLSVPLPAHSRVNVPVTQASQFGAIVESDGPEIVVERAMYSNAGGQVWAAGSAILATRLGAP